jgi:hypothetical protein
MMSIWRKVESVDKPIKEKTITTKAQGYLKELKAIITTP